jgi:hypothetical protein
VRVDCGVIAKQWQREWLLHGCLARSVYITLVTIWSKENSIFGPNWYVVSIWQSLTELVHRAGHRNHIRVRPVLCGAVQA